MSARLLMALEFAERAHRGQPRKYTGEPYIVHPIEVAQLVASVGRKEDTVIAALLHDTVEDCGVTLDQIAKAFGNVVAHIVHEVTDVSRPQHGNRATRKALDKAHSALASAEGQTVKLADMISNTRSIMLHDPEFAKVYMAEKAELLKVLTRGSSVLYDQAKGLVDAWINGRPTH